MEACFQTIGNTPVENINFKISDGLGLIISGASLSILGGQGLYGDPDLAPIKRAST